MRLEQGALDEVGAVPATLALIIYLSPHPHLHNSVFMPGPAAGIVRKIGGMLLYLLLVMWTGYSRASGLYGL